jgi:hypothetical protein
MERSKIHLYRFSLLDIHWFVKYKEKSQEVGTWGLWWSHGYIALQFEILSAEVGVWATYKDGYIWKREIVEVGHARGISQAAL